MPRQPVSKALRRGAVAAGVARASQLASKIAILDWDVQHGNGTQEIFYDDERVLFISLHRFGERCYPGTGSHDETGEEAYRRKGSSPGLPRLPLRD